MYDLFSADNSCVGSLALEMQGFFLCVHLMGANLGLQTVPSKENNNYCYLLLCPDTLSFG